MGAPTNMLKVLFFARLKEQLGTDSIEVSVDTPLTINELKAHLIAQNSHWQAPLTADNLICAINHEVVCKQHTIESTDEVAFFPPVTGG